MYSYLNVAGLSIGIACFVLVLLYIQDELMYDTYSTRSDQIYRMVLSVEAPDRGSTNTARTPPPWAPALKADFPEVKSFVRFKSPLVSWLISFDEEDKRFHEKGFYFADPDVFEMFDFKLLKGNIENALVQPNTVVITESTAKRYFGDRDPMGLVLRADNTYDFTITGVMQDVPKNSHITFDFLASFESLNVLPIYGGQNYGRFENTGLFPDIYTYLLFEKDFKPQSFIGKMPAFLEKYLGDRLEQFNIKLFTDLQPLETIHLHSHLEAEVSANSDISYIYIFSAIGFIILVIACINFMNLATVSSTNRNREVGMRKVLGAHRWQLVFQFIGESLLISIIALAIALVFTQLLLPIFNELSGKDLSIDLLDIRFILTAVIIAILVGLFSGSYPAFFLSSYTPDAVFRGKSRKGPAGSFLRKVLVIAQFTISAIFIVGTLIVNRQMNYIQMKDLGFEKERKIVLPFGDPRARQIYLTFKQELSKIPEVFSSAGAITVPGGLINVGAIEPEGRPEGENVLIDQIFIDHDFISTLGIKLTDGRDFSVDYPADTLTAFIINESAVRHFEWDDEPLGKRINIGEFKQGRVIGVVQDFHVKSLHQNIEPLLLHIAPNPDLYHYFVIRIAGENINKTIAEIEECWYRIYPQDPFIYSFLDEDFDSLYLQEELRGQIFSSFSLLAIIIACLGLFGLASYTAEIRTREIGIRKVFGAEVRSIISMLSWDFTRLILIANILAWPIAYLFLRSWLQNFAYRTNIPIWIYLVAIAISMVIALLTVFFQAFRAATRNPADSLRYE